MKTITFISDTHSKHEELTPELTGGWMIIHCGDFSESNYDAYRFMSWYSSLNYEYKIFIAGNHDFCFENNSVKPMSGLIYLFDDYVKIDGLTIYGSPWQPRFYDWAFNVDRGESIAKKWKKIPKNTDILITHGPPFGILDDTIRGDRVGCQDLYDKVMEINPKIHAFGHIHYGYGMKKIKETTFINASSVDEQYIVSNKPIIFKL